MLNPKRNTGPSSGGPEDFAKVSADLQKVSGRLAAEKLERRRLEAILRSLPSQILVAQETERRRIAAELHDGVNQILASIKFRLAHLEGQVKGESGESISEARRLLERAVQEVRRISHNLRPSELDDFGLIAAIEGLIDEFRQRTKITVQLKRGPLPRRLPAQVELAIYRILQEALANVEHHAEARRVTISLVADENFATLNVRDDGKGFADVEKAKLEKRGRGLGIIHMRERTNALGGVFAIESAPGRGTEISVHVKLQQ